MTSRHFTREQLEELDVPYTNLHDEQVDTLRWSEIRSCVFRAEDGKTYEVTYQVPATEHQECDTWFDENQITATEVEQRPVTVMQWMPVPPAAEEVAACGKCKQPFDPTDTRFDGRAQHKLTPYCR